MLHNARLEDDGKTIVIHIPMKFKRRGGRRQIILPPETENQEDKPFTPLQIALARAYEWRKMLDSGEASSIGEISDMCELDRSFVSKNFRLSFLAPDIVEAILEGIEPEGLSIEKLFKSIPAIWEDQRVLYGFI